MGIASPESWMGRDGTGAKWWCEHVDWLCGFEMVDNIIRGFSRCIRLFQGRSRRQWLKR